MTDAPGNCCREIKDVADRRAPKGINALGIVADHRDAGAVRAEELDDLGLQRIGVLILVHEHVGELPPHGFPGVGVEEKLAPVKEQVVEVQHALGCLPVAVGREEPLQVGDVPLAPGKFLLDDLHDRPPRVDAGRVDGHARRLLGKQGVGRVQPQFGANEVHEVFGVSSVVDREVWLQADPLAVPAQETGGNGVKRTAPNLLSNGGVVLGGGGPRQLAGNSPQISGDAAQHLLGRPPREGQQQDTIRVNAIGNLASDPRGQGLGLSRARPGNDKQRVVAVGDGALLLWVQIALRGRDEGGAIGVQGLLNHVTHLPPQRAIS